MGSPSRWPGGQPVPALVLAAAVLAVAIPIALGTAVDRVLGTMRRRTAPVAV